MTNSNTEDITLVLWSDQKTLKTFRMINPSGGQ
jgi:hypothetical protein